MGDRLQVSLLGRIEARCGDDDVAIVGTKLQTLFALLALAAPGSVSSDRLIDEIWGDDPPGNPANALQAQVSQLRRLTGSKAVLRSGTGYSLVVDPSDVDAQRVEQLVDEGRSAAAEGHTARAGACFASAAALARGPALPGLADVPFAREAATRIDQLLLAAHEGDVDAKLASGRHAEVTDRLQTLVAEHPLREHLHAQLITALYRSGRQADALAAYQNLRTILLEELGLDPSQDLQALERAVLSHDPALAAPVPLASARPPATLPVALTSFVGRARELDLLDEAAARSRLLTLVGPGGVGKTRLVVELAHRLASSGEVWFVELAPVTDPVAVPETVASALGAHDHSPSEDPTAARSPTLRAVDRIGDRPVTVILDNCEHVAAAAAQLAEILLTTCPELKLIATSREPLGIAGEMQIPVEPLSEVDAATLFTERARAVQPGIVAGEDDDDIVQLCHRLDRLPLAIELAAARTKSLHIPEITARLDDRFQLLRTSARGGDVRHSGLGATIDWSFEMLFEDERRTFCRLSLFAGGATVDAARSVCGEDVLDVLLRLVDRSLVIAETAGAESRFRMLESLRAYGIDRLTETGDLDLAVADYLDWCLGLAAAAERPVRGTDQVRWLDRLDAEHDNLRAGLALAVDADPSVGLRLIGSLVLPWYFRGRRQEARHWAETFLDAATDPPPADLAKALAWCGFIAESSGWTGTPGGMEQELELAERRQRHALELSVGVGDDEVSADVRMLLLATLTRRAVAGLMAPPDEFAALVRTALQSYEALGDDYGSGIVRLTEAITALAGGDLHHAAVATEEASAHAQRSGDRFTISRVEWLLGMLDDIGGDALGAYQRIERSLRLLDELGMGQAVTAQASLLAPLAERAGMPELASQWRAYVDGRAPGAARDDMLTMASTRNGEGLRARAAGDFDRAVSAHLQARTWYEEASVSGGIAFTESCLGFLASEMADTAGAVSHHREALAAAVTANEPAALALALEGVAATLVDDDPERATTLLGAASKQWAMTSARSGATHRAEVARVEEAARQQLGSPTFDAAFERGVGFGRSEALATAHATRVPTV